MLLSLNLVVLEELLDQVLVDNKVQRRTST